MRRPMQLAAFVSLLAVSPFGPLTSAACMAQSAPGPAARGGKGVRQMFDEAQSLYEAGRYQQALAAYAALLRKYPSHEPAIIQTAKTLYRMDALKDAFNVFQRVNPQHLDPETSYEYGWSFYTAKQWEGALYGFQRVPKNHALFDLANYYGGICAIKLSRYEEAGDMLEKAVVLPDKLAKSRAVYIKHLQALVLMQQKNALSKERQQERNKLKGDNRKKKPDAGEAALATTTPQTYKHPGRKSIERYATVQYTSSQQYIEFAGLKTTKYDARVAQFDLASGLIVPLSMKLPKERRAAFGGQINLVFEDRDTSGQEQMVLVNDSNDDLSRILQTNLDKVHTYNGIVSASPWIEFPLPQDMWLSFGGDIQFVYPKFERQGRTGTRDVYLGLGGATKELAHDSKIQYTEILDSETQAITTIVGGIVEVSAPLAKRLVGIARVSFNQYDYLIPALELNGPDSVTRGEAELAHDFGFGISLTLLGAYEHQANAQFHKMPTYGQLAADGSITSGKLSFAAAPFPWVSFEVSELISKTDWSLGNDQQREVFERNVPDYIEHLEIKAALNLFF